MKGNVKVEYAGVDEEEEDELDAENSLDELFTAPLCGLSSDDGLLEAEVLCGTAGEKLNSGSSFKLGSSFCCEQPVSITATAVMNATIYNLHFFIFSPA